MTIRFTCAECSSVLKIKDELAGTKGRCPKCKSEFVVPSAMQAEPISAADNRAMPSEPNKLPQPPAQAISAATIKSDQSTDSVAPQKESSHYAMTTAADEPTLATNGEGPAEAIPTQTLRLDDDAGDGLSDGPSNSSNQEVESARSNFATDSDDDDDLDSPPVFMSSSAFNLKPKSTATESMHSDRSILPVEKPTSTKKPRTNLSDDSFDPMKYLMPERSTSGRSAFDSNISDDSGDLELPADSDFDMLDRPSPQPLTRRTPMVASTRPTPEKVDLATAARMMKKAIKDSQAEAAHQREMEAKAGFDFLQIFRGIGPREIGTVVGLGLMVYLLYIGMDRMTSTRMKLPPLGYVTGKVTLDGQPMAGALVFMAPMEAEISKHERVRTSLGVTDRTGFFRMMYLPAERIEGVAVGRCRVWVTHQGDKGDDVPSEWSEWAMQIRDVTAGRQKSGLDLKMESKKVLGR